MKKYLYKHIINNKITELDKKHPLENQANKLFFIDFLCKDLNLEKSNINEISEGKNNLFIIYFEKNYYNIFIEFPDGGGRDISFNSTSKKIAIPFHIKAFKKILENYEPVLVINLYIPLKSNKKDLDLENRVYLIINPQEIYSSKVIKNKTSNSSSRWVKLEEILDIINNKVYKLNNKKNVYIVHWKKIKWFFDNILKEEYLNMINYELSNISLTDLDNSKKNKYVYTKYRQLFRELLISNRGIKCEIINCKIDIIQLLVASHIKPVNMILKNKNLIHEQKIAEISDPNNGLLLCPNHDALFDKFFITFDQNGLLITTKIIHDKIEIFNLSNNLKMINVNKQMNKYLKFHNFLLKTKEKYL